MLVAAFWLLVTSCAISLAMLGIGLCLLAMSSRFNPRDAWFIGMTFTLWGSIFSASAVACAWAVRSRKWRNATREIALFPLALFLPFGTIAGIFTYIVLGSPNIRAVYEHDSRV
jgi:hypothetical protein